MSRQGSGVPPEKASGKTAEIDATVVSAAKPSAWDGAPPETWIGKSLGKYQIISILGKGGMGVVFRGRDPLIQRDVAIKVLAPGLAADNKALSRFLTEARAVGKLSHPNVVSIHEISHDNDIYFLVMEFIPGGSLSERLEKSGPLSPLLATKAMIDACRGVAAAHAAGFVHRDLKPANMMCAADGSIKVMDFGLAKSLTDAAGQTQTGITLGTPFFMSPEQCQAKPVDARSDVYSLGATYYTLLTGRYPYETAGTQMQVLYQHCEGPIPDPREINPALPATCARIVAQAMAKRPADRYSTATEMLADLQASNAPFAGKSADCPPPPPPSEPSSVRQWTAIGAGVLLVGVLALALFFWGPWAGPRGTPIKVGIIHSLSGTMAGAEEPVLDATRFALEEINSNGGLLGRPVKYVIADGRSDENVFAVGARHLIKDEQVSVLFGCWTSSSRKAILPVIHEFNHLLIYPLQYEGLEASPNVIYLGAVPNQQILPAIDWAMQTLGKKRFFLVGSDYVFPHAAHEIIKDHVKKSRGEIVDTAYVPMGSLDMGGLLEKIEKAQPDMILNTINGDSNLAFLRLLRPRFKAGELPVLSFSVTEQQMRSLDAALVQGDYAAWTYFQAIEGKENEEFVKRLQAKLPKRRITDPMATAYFGVKLWAQAVKEAESVDPGPVRRALLRARLSTPAGEIRIDPETQHCYQTPRIGQVDADGNFAIRWTAAGPVAPVAFPPTRPAREWQLFLNELQTHWNGKWTGPH